jgi:hypothetical protein
VGGAATSLQVLPNGWLYGDPESLHAELPPDLEDLACNDRMQLEMLVDIDMIEPKAGSAVGLELRPDLTRHLPLQAAPQSNLKCHIHHVAAKDAGVIDQTGDRVGRECRPALDEDEVKPDPEALHPLRTGNRVRSRRS